MGDHRGWASIHSCNTKDPFPGTSISKRFGGRNGKGLKRLPQKELLSASRVNPIPCKTHHSFLTEELYEYPPVSIWYGEVGSPIVPQFGPKARNDREEPLIFQKPSYSILFDCLHPE